ncbi:hypothetical protein BSI_08630 [Bacillus inaquosorum KCTC 13429]|uniref:Uncharacterized protein n=1 Tax=Bacillus inaquosorum KCTC 13429 TaxID=1236548 RepID=A0A9W5LJD2_9BACI|nr:hypothetical protein BSI_08630 [Bacillus inaquosorum KCTC 13429]
MQAGYVTCKMGCRKHCSNLHDVNQFKAPWDWAINRMQ